MSAKMGRPLKGCSILAHEVKARIDDRTYNELQQYCIENDLKTAEAIRYAISKMLSEKKE